MSRSDRLVFRNELSGVAFGLSLSPVGHARALIVVFQETRSALLFALPVQQGVCTEDRAASVAI